MKIEIYGTGCDKCTKLYEVADNAAKSLGIEYDIEKVSEVSPVTLDPGHQSFSHLG